MESKNCNVSISKSVDTLGKSKIVISVRDQNFNKLSKITMTLENFAAAITGQGFIPCIYEERKDN